MSIRLSRRVRNRSLSSSAGLGTRWGRIGLSSRFERESQPPCRRKTLLDLAHEIASFLADQAQIQAIPNTLRRPNPPIFPGAQSFSRATSSKVTPSRRTPSEQGGRRRTDTQKVPVRRQLGGA